MTTLDLLNQEFAIPKVIRFYQAEDGATIVDINNDLAHASISLSGGQVLTWQPKEQAKPVIWLSEQAVIAPGKSIRGGIPICWPWFGAHPTDTHLPNHGFARTSSWKIVRTAALTSGETEIELQLPEHDNNKHFWPYSTKLSLLITIGSKLSLSLTTHNTSEKAIVISEALHTYFQISDIANIHITGLDNTEYLDKVENFSCKHQQGDIHFAGETDRVYINSTSSCQINDSAYARSIVIKKSASKSTVVWSPGEDKAIAMADLGNNHGWRQMVCVESGNAMDNNIELSPDNSHCLAVEYSVTPLKNK